MKTLFLGLAIVSIKSKNIEHSVYRLIKANSLTEAEKIFSKWLIDNWTRKTVIEFSQVTPALT